MVGIIDTRSEGFAICLLYAYSRHCILTFVRINAVSGSVCSFPFFMETTYPLSDFPKFHDRQ